MRKQRIDSVPADPRFEGRPGWEGASVHWLVDRTASGAQKGMLALVRVAPGAEIELHRQPRSEKITYVLEGTGLHTTPGAPVRQGARDAVLVRPGDWHGFRNDADAPALLLALYGGASDFDDLEYERLAARGGAPAQAAPVVVSTDAAPEDPDLAEDQGWIGLHVKWLITEREGATQALLGISWFDSGGSHVLHRHPLAEEILVLGGRGGTHLEPDGEYRVDAGDVTFAGRGDWHGFRNDPDGRTSTVFFYVGGASLDAVGYELYA